MNANILMVDDSKTIRFQVRKILEAEPDNDYKISEAGDGKEALDFVAASAVLGFFSTHVIAWFWCCVSGFDCLSLRLC